MLNRVPQWWKNAVVYQIYPRSFADSNGDGIGDLRGIIGKLDYLADLGVDVLWLSPIYPSPQCDTGYDISDYCDIDPVFGTLADFDELLARAHARGMGIMIDIVINHTSDQHPWFQQSRTTGSDKADWYLWRSGEDGPPYPTRNIFGEPSWAFDEQRGQYYFHIFAPQQPDLNWENPQVRQALHKMMNWWADRGVDGFRFDVINLISKPHLIHHTPATVTTPVDGPQVHQWLQELHTEVLRGRNLITVGEMPGTTPEEATRYTDPQRGEIDMVFQFEHVDLDSRGSKWDLKPLYLPELKHSLARWQHGVGERGWNSLYWMNHDQPRIVSRWGDDSDEHRENSAKTLATVLHLHRGTPYIYQGEELGMVNAGFDRLEQYRDLESIEAYEREVAAGRDPEDMLHALRVKSRDNARTPMHWDASPQAGFTTGVPWLEIQRTDINVADQLDEPNSVLAHYRRLIALRHDHAVVCEGVFDLLYPEHEQLWALTRTLGEERWLVLANISTTPVAIPDELRLAGHLLLGTHDEQDPAQLAAWESRVIRLV